MIPGDSKIPLTVESGLKSIIKAGVLRPGDAVYLEFLEEKENGKTALVLDWGKVVEVDEESILLCSHSEDVPNEIPIKAITEFELYEIKAFSNPKRQKGI